MYFTALVRKFQNKLCTLVQKIIVSSHGISKKYYLYLNIANFDHSHLSCKCSWVILYQYLAEEIKIPGLLLKPETRIIFPKKYV